MSSPRLVQYASCPVHDLSSPRDVQSASRPVRELAICELAYPRVVHLSALQPQTTVVRSHIAVADTVCALHKNRRAETLSFSCVYSSMMKVPVTNIAWSFSDVRDSEEGVQLVDRMLRAATTGFPVSDAASC